MNGRGIVLGQQGSRCTACVPRVRQFPCDRLAQEDFACCHPMATQSVLANTCATAAPFLEFNDKVS